MNETASPDLSTTEGRIAAACQWFDLAPPELAYDPDEPEALLLTADLVGWLRAARLSFDWLFEGDPKGALIAYRKERLTEQRFVEAIRGLGEEELELLKGTMILLARKELAAEDVSAAFEAGRAELQAKRGAQSTEAAKGDGTGDGTVERSDADY